MSVIGFGLALNTYGWVVVAALPALLAVLPYHTLQFWLQTRYPYFDHAKHEAHLDSYWRGKTTEQVPSVAIYLPVAGEPLATVKNTLRAIMSLDYPCFTAYVLDDTPAGTYQGLAHRLGAEYLRRPASGQDKKSGNLNYALQHTPPSDHVLVLDADFAPCPEMLKILVPYADDDISIVQTPQHFPLSRKLFATAKIAYGASYMQRSFYKYVETAAQGAGAALCLGTNALYSRRALAAIGGFRVSDHGEDIETGLASLNHPSQNGKPYRTRYVPLQLAHGTCPETYFSYFKQQSRWATGGYRLAVHRTTLLSRTLSITQKIAALAYSLSYIYPAWWLLAPAAVLVIAAIPAEIGLWPVWFLIPHLIIVASLQAITWERHRASASLIVSIAHAYIYTQAFWLWLRGRPLGWEPTGAIVDTKHARFVQLKWCMAGYSLVVCGGALLLALLRHEGWYAVALCLAIAPFLALHARHFIYAVTGR